MRDAKNAPAAAWRTHAMLIVSLLTLTLAAGVAARIGGGSPVPLPDPNDPNPVTTSHAGGVELSAALDRTSVLQGGDGTLRVELVMSAEERPSRETERVPTDLVVILDRSTSMRGAPLQFAKSAVRELISQLGQADRFGLVAYGSDARVEIPLEAATGEARGRWERVLAEVRVDGGTNLSLGLDRAHTLVAEARSPERAPRIVLLSDGHANQGDPSLEGLRRRAGRAVQSEYVLSSVGIGQGFDEVVMSQIADAGTGNFYYLARLDALAGIFADEFAAARERVARALEVRWRSLDGVELIDAAGLPLERDGDAVRFRPGDLFAGQERRVWLTLRAPTGDLGEIALGDVALAFTDDEGERHDLRLASLPRIACVEDEVMYFAGFDDDTYKRASSTETLGRLKQKVAGFMKEGRQEEAVAEVEETLEALEREQMNALGYVASEANADFEALRDLVAAPKAAAPMEQNLLGKRLLEEGRDARRSGSKR